MFVLYICQSANELIQTQLNCRQVVTVTLDEVKGNSFNSRFHSNILIQLFYKLQRFFQNHIIPFAHTYINKSNQTIRLDFCVLTASLICQKICLCLIDIFQIFELSFGEEKCKMQNQSDPMSAN